VQADRAFEHDARLNELLARRAELKVALDLDKGDAQAAQVRLPLSRFPASSSSGESKRQTATSLRRWSISA